MAYFISEEAQEMREDLKRFCKADFQEACRQADRTGEWPAALYQQAMELGYQTLDIPEEWGGLGLSFTDRASFIEEMAIQDAGFAVTFAASNLALQAVLFGGSAEQCKQACDLVMQGALGAFCLTEPEAGSDAGAGRTTAVREGDFYVLNGHKCFITNGSVAGFYCVTAHTDRTKGIHGMSLFLVEAGTEGLSAGNHEDKMGIRTSDTCDVMFDDVRIPRKNRIGAEGQGYKLAMAALDRGRAFMGCIAVGIAQRCLLEAVAYGSKREQFGKPVMQNQGLQFKLAEMDIKTETARQMTAYVMERMQRKLPIRREAAIAKSYAADTAVASALEAIQILGGYGYSREYPVEKLLRDAKIFQIFEGTNEILKMVVAKELI